jgi:hypothetical protein
MTSYTIDTSKPAPYLSAGVAFSVATNGKKSHLVELYPDGTIAPLCGSGSNIAGASLRHSSRFTISKELSITGDNLCSKCLKNPYIKELN